MLDSLWIEVISGTEKQAVDLDFLYNLSSAAFSQGEVETLEDLRRKSFNSLIITDSLRYTLNRFLQGMVFILQEKYSEASEVLNQSYHRFITSELTKYQTKSLSLLLLSLELSGKLSSAEQYLKQLEEEVLKLENTPANSKRKLAFFYTAADFHFGNDELAKAFKVSRQALVLAESIGDFDRIIDFNLFCGDILTALDLQDLARMHYHQSLEAFIQSPAPFDTLEYSYLKLVTIEDPHEADLLVSKIELDLQARGDTARLLQLWQKYIGWLYFFGNHELLPIYAKKILDHTTESNPHDPYLLWAQVHVLEGDVLDKRYTQVIKKGVDLLEFARTDNDIVMQEVLELSLGKAYAETGLYQQAYHSLERAYNLKDSIRELQEVHEFITTQIEYQLEKEKEFFAIQQQQEQELLDVKLMRQRLFSISLLTGLLLLLGLLFLFYRNGKIKEQANVQLEKSKARLALNNKRLRHFTSVISHDVMSKLDLIISTGNVLVDSNRSSVNDHLEQYYDVAQQNIKELKQYCHELLKQTYSEENVMVLHAGVADRLLDQTLEQYKQLLQQRNFKIIRTPLAGLKLPPAAVQQLFHNIISNALKYVPHSGKQPLLRFGSFEDEQGHIIWFIEDNGPGIPITDREKVLDPIIQNPISPTNRGVGLATVNKQLRLYRYMLLLEESDYRGLRILIEPLD